MAKYISNRQKNLKIGISSYTENNTVLEITGKVGIGTNNATEDLDVAGDVRLRGSLYDYYNTSGNSGQVLVSSGTGVTWTTMEDISIINTIINTTLTGISVEEESVGIGTTFTTLNFIGAGVTATASGDVAIITFTQQVGAQGVQGSQGIQGPQGTQGTQGVQGIQGSQGTQGVQGIQGSQGTQGTQGVQGIQGSQGPQGTQGVQGIQGSQGTQGTQGVQGIQGSQGTQGTQGVQGIQGSQGTQGTQGVQGIQGSQGTQGTQGVQGIQGSQGTQGTQGVQGIQGSQGTQGTQGVQGIQGSQGTQGTQGVQGIQGVTGPVAGSANQVVYKDASNIPTGSNNLTFDGTRLQITGDISISGIATANLTTLTSSTASPNNTINVAAIVATGANADYDLTLHPKGNGSLLSDIPDNTATGGNKRGINSIDLQLVRNLNTQVASGATSVIIGGRNNTSSGESSIVIGGIDNIASGRGSIVYGGLNNVANANFSAVWGGRRGTTRGLVGYQAYPAANIPFGDIEGAVQSGFIVLTASTIGAATSTLVSNALPANFNNQIFVPNNGIVFINAVVAMKQTNSNNYRVFDHRFTATKTGINAIALSNIVTNRIVNAGFGGDVDQGPNMQTPVVGIGSTNSVSIRVIGFAGATIRHVARVETTEFLFA